MRRNYTQVKIFLRKAGDKRDQLRMLSRQHDDRWTDGLSTTEIEKKYLETNQEYHRAVDLIRTEIEKLADEKEQLILKQRFLGFKSGYEIQNVMGGSEKHIKKLYDRARQSLELILIEDGLMPYQDPANDMMEDYRDGYRAGFRRGFEQGKSACVESQGEQSAPAEDSSKSQESLNTGCEFFDLDANRIRCAIGCSMYQCGKGCANATNVPGSRPPYGTKYINGML